MTPTREEVETLVAHNKALIDRNVALRERLEAVEAERHATRSNLELVQAALTEARAREAAAWEAGRDAAAATMANGDLMQCPDHEPWFINRWNSIRHLTPPTDATAALTAVKDAEWNRIADALEAEADMLPCEEDAAVTRSNANLIRARFSYDEAEAIALRRNPKEGV